MPTRISAGVGDQPTFIAMILSLMYKIFFILYVTIIVL